ncbi:MAG: MFS transporter [Desulfobacteraceae bacterium]|nr:MFS transporter [Desulfobacteraceae bacterium]
MKLFDRDDYRYSFFDGMCANVYANLTGGAFLTGFALSLGMNDLMIGVLLAIPFIVTLFQIPGSYFICRKGRRKSLAYWTATISRLLWLPLLVIGLLPFESSGWHPFLVLACFLVLQAFSSVSYIAWISWTSDLVPDEIRGTFFGVRNMLCGAAGIASVLIFGNLLDILKADFGRTTLIFGVPFGCAVIFGLMSSHFLKRIPDVLEARFDCKSFWQELLGPFRDQIFRRYLVFALCWNFSVHMATPFFFLYFLRELKYSYGFIAMLTTIAALVDLFAVRFWGTISDRVKNKAVIQLTGWGVAFLPALWALVRPQDLLLPIVIQVLSGGFWAGVGLCTSNLQLRISPQQGRVWFLSVYSITAGLGGAVAPIAGGLILSVLNHYAPTQTNGGALSLHYIFIASSLLRILSMLVLQFVREPQEKNLRQLFQALFGFQRSKLAVLQHAPAAAVPKVSLFMRAFKRPMARQQV